MPIEINSTTNRVVPPVVRLTGQLIDETAGTYAASGLQRVNTQQVVIDGTDVTRRDTLAFFGDVQVKLVADPNYTSNDYSNRAATDIVGATAPTISNVAQNAETYYTVNGKDPTRTKANLYTGQFTVRQNLSGSDNLILKARTYVQGKWSEVRTVEIKINRAVDTTV